MENVLEYNLGVWGNFGKQNRGMLDIIFAMRSVTMIENHLKYVQVNQHSFKQQYTFQTGQLVN